ncbi:MAG: ribosome maturation factor RimM [Muribaculaceae bacterium]|nr:ribosome maturation factor RimM [Muribaculaceae bacterium]
MITRSDLDLVGKVNKTHGIDGELSISMFDPVLADAIDVDDCMLFDIDGIFVPFFIDGVRPRGNESILVTFDGESSREAVAGFVGKDVFMTRERVMEVTGDADTDDGMYAGSLIGFRAVTAEGDEIGVIEDIDDSSENPLFIVGRGDVGKPVLIPIVDDFIVEISDGRIVFDLPDGLLDL